MPQPPVPPITGWRGKESPPPQNPQRVPPRSSLAHLGSPAAFTHVPPHGPARGVWYLDPRGHSCRGSGCPPGPPCSEALPGGRGHGDLCRCARLGACLPSLPWRQQGGGSRGWGGQQVPGSGLTSASGSQVEATEPQHVVVYDQSTRDASVLAADSFLSILLSKLDGCFDSVAILTGASGAAPCLSAPGGWAGAGLARESRFWTRLCSPPEAQGPGAVWAVGARWGANPCSSGILGSSPSPRAPTNRGHSCHEQVDRRKPWYRRGVGGTGNLSEDVVCLGNSPCVQTHSHSHCPELPGWGGGTGPTPENPPSEQSCYTQAVDAALQLHGCPATACVVTTAVWGASGGPHRASCSPEAAWPPTHARARRLHCGPHCSLPPVGSD